MLRRVLPAANAIFLGHVMVRLGSLVLVPLFLRYWSPISYGEYLALFAAVGYLGSLDIGMQWAATNRLTQAYARNDLDEYRTVQHSSLFFYLVISAGVTLLVASLVWLFPISHWIGLRVTKPTAATLVIILLAGYVMWSMPMRLISAIYQTMGNLARSQWIANAQQLLVVLLSALVLILGGGMLAIASLQILTEGAGLSEPPICIARGRQSDRLPREHSPGLCGFGRLGGGCAFRHEGHDRRCPSGAI